MAKKRKRAYSHKRLLQNHADQIRRKEKIEAERKAFFEAVERGEYEYEPFSDEVQENINKAFERADKAQS